MKKCFVCRDAFRSELPLLQGDDPRGAYGLIASLNGDFGQNGSRVSAIIDEKNYAADTRQFTESLDALFHFLKTSYDKGLLANAQAMCSICARYADEQGLYENGQKIVGFETHTDDYQYYIKCVPKKKVNSSYFVIHCYDRKKLLEAGMIYDKEGV